MCCMWLVKEGLREMLIFGQSPERGERLSNVNCRSRIPGKGHSKCKGPAVGTCLFVSCLEQESQGESERGTGNKPSGPGSGLVGTLASALGEMGARGGL